MFEIYPLSELSSNRPSPREIPQHTHQVQEYKLQLRRVNHNFIQLEASQLQKNGRSDNRSKSKTPFTPVRFTNKQFYQRIIHVKH